MSSCRYRVASVMKPRRVGGHPSPRPRPSLVPSPHPFPLISPVILLLTFARHPLLIFHFLRLNLTSTLYRLFFLPALSCPFLGLRSFFFLCTSSIFEYKKAASFIIEGPVKSQASFPFPAYRQNMFLIDKSPTSGNIKNRVVFLLLI